MCFGGPDLPEPPPPPPPPSAPPKPARLVLAGRKAGERRRRDGAVRAPSLALQPAGGGLAIPAAGR